MQKMLRDVLIVLVLFNAQTMVHAATPPVVYVAGDGSGFKLSPGGVDPCHKHMPDNCSSDIESTVLPARP